MTTQEKIQELLEQEKIAREYLPFEVSVSLKANYPTREKQYNLIFPNVRGVMSREEISAFLQANPAHESLEISTKYKNKMYFFKYDFNLSSNPSGSEIKLCYIDRKENKIYLSFPIEWVRDYFTYSRMNVPDTQLHYFGGIARNQIGKISCATWGYTPSLSYHGGHERLACREAAEKIFKFLISYP